MRQQKRRTISKKNEAGVMASLDWFTVLIYVLLMAMGWVSICGASYDFDQAGNFFDFSTRSGMQIVWIGTSLILASIILMIDERVMETFSYIIYVVFLGLLFVTPVLARDIKGSMSWIKIGAFSLQPAEFAKFGVALCVAKVMSTHGFSLQRWRDLAICIALVLIPMGLIVMQKETGSALVYASFFLMFYREGMTGSFLFAVLSAVLFFVVGVRCSEMPVAGIPSANWGQVIVFALIHLFTVGLLYAYTKTKHVTRRIFWGGVLAMVAGWIVCKNFVAFNFVWVQVAVCVVTVLFLFYFALRERIGRYFYIGLFAMGAMVFHYSSNYVLNNVMQKHQQTRIRVLLGLEDDPRGAGYNVIQAQIAIGSGGLRGKGFLNGTQTKLKYVPEQDTDFIFCTVGEEEGFLGCAVVLGLFLTLILRLIHLAERQPFTFGRVYGYCVVGVFLFHVFVNVGMVLGLTPVIGIPLPFFSYGGSSLWGFTILLFIFLRIDCGRNRLKH